MTLRIVAFGVSLCVLAVLAAFTTPAGPAQACSLVGFSRELLPFAVESSSTIAVGRLVKGERDVITLEVEEGLKGARAGERLTVSNATLGLGAGCQVYLEPNGKGFALPEGARVLAFLEANELGGPAVLRSALYGYGIFTLDGEFIRDGRAPGASFARVREEIRNLDREPADLNIETIGPCNRDIDLRDDANLRRHVRMSTVIAVGKYRSVGGGVAELEVEQVLRGDTGGSKTLRINAHSFFLGTACRPIMEPASGSFPVSFRALVFLRPDDYGVTDWRGAIWGYAAFAIVGDEVQGPLGLPTLAEVRAAVRGGDGSDPVVETGARATKQDRYRLWIGVVMGLAGCAGGAAWVLARRRRR